LELPIPLPRRRTLRLRDPGLSWRLDRVRRAMGRSCDGWMEVDVDERGRCVEEDDGIWRERFVRDDVMDVSVGVASLVRVRVDKEKVEGECRRAVVVARERHRVVVMNMFRAAIVVSLV